MNYWESLSKQIVDAASSGRIGQPVFARLTVIVNPSEDLAHTLTGLVNVSSKLMSANVFEVYVLGDVSSGHLSATVTFANNATALIAVGTAGATRIDLSVYGSHGSMLFDDSLDFYEGLEDFGTVMPTLESCLQDSLSSGEPVRLQVTS